MRFTVQVGALTGALLVSIGAPGLSRAQPDFGGIMRSVAGSLPASRPAAPAPARAAAPARSAAPADSGAMGLQGSALPPLRRLGTDAVAVVESASPNASVKPMDYVFAKQSIKLGPSGRLTMSYLSGCLTEVIQGGTVTVALGGSTVAGGKRQERVTPGCRAAKPVILTNASEAGATVNRITPFTGADWNERAVKSTLPVFKWDQATGVVTLRIKDMDKTGEPVVWQVESAQTWVAYPPTAAKLVVGDPYRAEVVSGGAVVAQALFSIDPALDVADSMANRVVPLSKP